MTSEIWKDIAGYEGYYQVSNLGNVKSLKRESIGAFDKVRIIKEKVLKVRTEKQGYQIVSLYIDGSEVKKKVHRVMAEAFILNPDNKPCINHKNGVKDDNRIDNLEWCTKKENTIHSYKTGLQVSCKPRSKVVLDLATGIYYDTAKEAASAKNLLPSTLRSRLNGTIKTNNTSLMYV